MKASVSKYHLSEEQLDKERVLIEEAKKNVDAFDALYRKYFEQIFYFILKRVEQEDVAADICSQVFLKALTNLAKYKYMGLPFSSWLFRIARNEMFDLHKKDKIEMVVSIENKGIQMMIAELGNEEKEDYHKLHQALSRLEAEDMELLELRFFEDRPFKEIGEILAITENNAKVRTYRILDKLKKLLQ